MSFVTENILNMVQVLAILGFFLSQMGIFIYLNFISIPNSADSFPKARTAGTQDVK